MGGCELADAGATIVASSETLSVMGAVETISSIPTHVRLHRVLARRLRAGRYDLAVLVDYPGFNMSLAAVAAQAGVPVLYYVAPQLWAWGEWRVARLRRHVQSLAVVLPFEQQFFTERGVVATFVGHPLLDRASPVSGVAARRTLGIPDTGPVLGVFPGSRYQEVRRLWPVLRDAARRLTAVEPRLTVVVAGTRMAHYPDAEGFTVWRGAAELVHAAADVSLCKSGTTTLEAALSDTPMVIAYRMHRLSYAIAKRAVNVPYVGLVNLIVNRGVVPELIQQRATPDALAAAAMPLLDVDGRAAREQREAFREVRARLGSPGAAQRVSSMALTMVA